MDRVTAKDNDGYKLVLKNSVECVSGNLKKWSVNISTTGTQTIRKYAVDKLAKYEDLEEQGKLLKLSCAVGDTVYYPDDYYGIVVPVKISEIIIGELNTAQYSGCFFDGNGDPEKDYDFEIEDFGKTVFLTKEEAENALHKMNGMEGKE